MKRIQRQLLVALGLFAGGGLALAYTLVEKVKTPEQRHQEDRNSKRLFQFGRIEVQKATLWARGATVTFERQNEGWRLSTPVVWPANTEAVDAMLDRMTGIVLDPIISESATEKELRELHLDHPRQRLQVDLASGPLLLRVGPKNELQNRYPVTDGPGQKIGLTDPSFIWALDRAVEDFRDKHLFPISAKTVTELIVTPQEGPLCHLTRAETWTVRCGAVTVPGDANSIDTLLVRLTQHLTADEFLTDTYTADSAQYGLDKPIFRVRLKTQDAEYSAHFGQVPDETADKSAVAHLIGTQTVIRVDSGILDILRLDPARLRDRALLRFDRNQVAQIQVYFGDKKIELERRGADWIVLGPSPRYARTWKVDAFLAPYSKLQGDALHSEAPSVAQSQEWMLSPPGRRVVFFDAQKKVLAELKIGNYATEKELLVQSGAAPQVFRLADIKVKVLPAQLEDILDPERPEPPSP